MWHLIRLYTIDSLALLIHDFHTHFHSIPKEDLMEE